MPKQSHPRLRKALSLVGKGKEAAKFPEAFKYIVWELMTTQTKVTRLEEKLMDRKMHQVTKRMKTAEKDIKSGKPKVAARVLKKAEAKNERLVKIDKNVRDPLIHKAKKVAKKFPGVWNKVK